MLFVGSERHVCGLIAIADPTSAISAESIVCIVISDHLSGTLGTHPAGRTLSAGLVGKEFHGVVGGVVPTGLDVDHLFSPRLLVPGDASGIGTRRGVVPFGDEFVDHYSGRMLNIHPSLLPRHPGLDTHRLPCISVEFLEMRKTEVTPQ